VSHCSSWYYLMSCYRVLYSYFVSVYIVVARSWRISLLCHIDQVLYSISLYGHYLTFSYFLAQPHNQSDLDMPRNVSNSTCERPRCGLILRMVSACRQPSFEASSPELKLYNQHYYYIYVCWRSFVDVWQSNRWRGWHSLVVTQPCTSHQLVRVQVFGCV